MSGSEINRSLALILIPIFFLFGIVIIILALPEINFAPAGDGFAGFVGSDYISGIVQIMPHLGFGLGLGMIFLLFCIIRRRSR